MTQEEVGDILSKVMGIRVDYVGGPFLDAERKEAMLLMTYLDIESTLH